MHPGHYIKYSGWSAFLTPQKHDSSHITWFSYLKDTCCVLINRFIWPLFIKLLANRNDQIRHYKEQIYSQDYPKNMNLRVLVSCPVINQI